MEEKREEVLYAALKSRDARFDGRFFVGVRSTGVYCRPVCRARLPKRENCTFFETAAQAEKAGYRPCLRCRPELAPGSAPVDAAASLAQRAARYIEADCKSPQSIPELAEKMGCTERHLRRVFAETYQVSPREYLQTCRLLLAKNLLTDTGLSVLEVAMTAGFGSLRRFNEVFKREYRLTPSALRRHAGTEGKKQGKLTLMLGYRPPYQWEKMLDFLKIRAIPGVEKVENGRYMRTVRLKDQEGVTCTGWLQVEHVPQKNALAVTVSAQLLPVLSLVLGKVRDLFDLYCEPGAVGEKLSAMDQIAPGLYQPGLRVPGCFDPFEMCVRAVLGQQITVKAATTLSGRIAKQFGTPLKTGIPGLSYVFPSAQEVLQWEGTPESNLGPLGVIAARARTIWALAQVFQGQELSLFSCPQPEKEIKKLLTLPGVGPWTAQYIAMRALGWTDAFPDTDLGVKKALAPRNTQQIRALAESWSPWRAYAVMCLWNWES